MSDPISRLNAALDGRYRIESELGKGGMATVYLADDLRHERKVAIKVLKPELAAVVGAERFIAEIKTTANLQHPHILPLFDSGEADSFLFYVMPYVKGETLRDRIDREGQLPVDEALRIAAAVANALQTAHEAGIVHRDIKPANILLSRGEPLVADFGIALALGAAGGGRLTEPGLSIGTPYYMSPEQATGDTTVGPTSDIFALACVLYEMLVGEPPYPGSTAQAVLGKIIQGVPVSATAARTSIPVNVDAAIRRALEKIPADRFEDAQSFAKALGNRGFRHGDAVFRSRISLNTLIATAVATALAGLALGWGMTPRNDEPLPVIRQRLEPLGSGLERSIGTYTALAPDGSSIVYASGNEDEEQWRLWLKLLGSTDAVPLSGTEYGKNPVYSPDSEWIAFHSQGSIKKRHLRDGTTLTLAEGVPTGEVAIAWLDDGTIVYEPSSPSESLSLVRIANDGGGVPDTVATWDLASNVTFAGALPGARGVLVGLCPSSCNSMELHVVDFESGTSKPLLTEAMRGWFVPTGHLVYVRNDGAVLAAPFDLDRLELTGPGTPLMEGVETVNSSPQIVIGADGTVLYLEAGATAAQTEVLWVDRSGSVEPVSPDLVGTIANVALSSDGQRIAATFLDQSTGAQLWVKELPAGAFTRLTTDEGLTSHPVWSGDDQTIAYVTNPDGPYEARTVRSDGSTGGGFEVLMESNGGIGIMEVFFTRDEAGLVFRTGDANTGRADLGYLELATGVVNDSILASSFNERGVSLSRDGRWMAYTSNSSGRDEVFVRPFPKAASQVTVSTAGGTDPVWAKDGNELFFVGSDGWLTVATYRTDPDFGVESVTRLFDATSFYGHSPDWRRFDVTRDGQRFLMVRVLPTSETGDRGPILIQNFFEEVKARVGN